MEYNILLVVNPPVWDLLFHPMAPILKVEIISGSLHEYFVRHVQACLSRIPCKMVV